MMNQLGGAAKTLQVVTNWCNTTTMNYFRHDILCVAAEINLLCVGDVSNLLCVRTVVNLLFVFAAL